MKKQKSSRLFRALLCSSALAGVAGQVVASEDGVSRVGPQASGPDPNGQDGIASTGIPQDGSSFVPASYYQLPQYQGGAPAPLVEPTNGPIWQDQMGPRVRMETRIGEWLGSEDNGDAGVNVMLPFWFGQSDAMLFLDARGTVSYSGGGASNIGAGIRRYDAFRDRVYGINAYWDHDNGNRRSYNQVGFGVESLGRYVDFRANGYFSFGTDRNIISSTHDVNSFQFGAGPTGVLVNRVEFQESAFSGLNVEIGTPTPLLGRYGFETHVGGYYFQADDNEDVTGVSVRNEMQISDDIRAGISVTNDDVFDTQVFATLSITIPDGRPQRWFRPKKVRDKMLSRIERRNRVMTNRRIKTTVVDGTPLLNRNGAPVNRFLVVDPQATTNGVGTAADPLNTFVGFSNTGTGTIFQINDGDLEGPLTLNDNDVVVTADFLNNVGLTLGSTIGDVVVPSPDDMAGPTIWRNSVGGTIVTVAGDNTQISGFIFDGFVNTGIPVNNDLIVGGGFEGFRINNNVFRNYRQAVTLSNVTGTIQVDPTTNTLDLTTSRPGQLYSNSFLGSSAFLGGTGLASINGFSLTNTGAGTLDLEVGQTQYNAQVTSLAAGSNFAYGNNGEDLNGNGILDPGEDILVNGELDEGAAFSITALNQATINARFHQNVTSAEGSLPSEDRNNNGILDPSEDTNNNEVLDFGSDLNQNGRFDGGNGRGIVVTAGLTQSTVNLAIVNNTLGNNTGDAVQLTANAGAINAANLGEDVNGNGIVDIDDVNLDGVFDPSEDLNFDGILEVSEDLNLNGMLDPGEDANNNGVLELGEDANGNGILDLNDDLDNDGVFDFGEDALEPDSNSNGVLDGTEDLNSDTFRNLGDMDRLLDGGFLITGNTFTNNGDDAVQGNVTNNGNLSVLMTANSIGDPLALQAGNGGAGLNISADSGLVDVQLGFLRNEDLDQDGVLDMGEDVNGNGRLDVPLAADGNNIVANGAGVIVNLTGTAVGQIDAIGNTFSGRGGGILGFQINGDTTGMPIEFVNLSPIGIDISEILWNVAPAGLEFNTDLPPVGDPFVVLNNTDASTGLQSVNGSAGPFVVPDQSTQLGLVFNDFNPINNQLDAGEDVNGNGFLDPSEDVNGNGILDSGEDTNEDLNGNRMLDPGEDSNGDGFLNLGNGDTLLTPSEDLPDRFTFQVDLDQSGVPSNVLGSDLISSTVQVTFSTGQVQTGSLIADPADATGSLYQANSNTIGMGDGISITASDTSTLLSGQIRNNSITEFGGNGISLQANDSAVVQNQIIRDNTISDNGQNGGAGGRDFGISLGTNGATAQLAAEIMNNTIERNAGGALNVDAQGGTISVSQFAANIVDENGAGVLINAESGASVDVRITSNSITDSVMNGVIGTPMTSGDAISVVSDASTVTVNEIAFNTITSNAGDGISLEALNGGTINVTPTEDLNSNNVFDNGEDVDEDANNNGILDMGEDANGDGLLNRGNGNGLFDRGIFMNLISNNAENSFAVTATDSTINLGTVSQNQLINSTAGVGGVQIVGVNSTLTGSFTGNSISLDPANNPNAGPGFLVDSIDGNVDLVIGGPDPGDRNTISRAVGAGIAGVFSGTGLAQLNITNNLVTSVSDDLDPNTTYDGDGISIALTGSPSTANSTVRLIQSEVTGNVIGSFDSTLGLGLDGSGIAIQASEETAIDDLLVTQNQVGQVGLDIGNNHAGIEIDRIDDATFNVASPRPGALRAVTISENIVTDNDGGGTTTVAGLDIDVSGGIRDDIDFEIIDNTFSRNSGDGVLLTTRADASLSTDIRGNTIEENGTVLNPITMLPGNGITMNGVETSINDLETQGGTWISNTINNNAGHGIQLNSVKGDIIPLIIGLNGNDPITGESLGNAITNNAGDGIEINSGGFVQINNNLIATNGGSGVDINAIAVGVHAALLQNNSIQNNGEDGIEFQNSLNSTDVGFLIGFGNSITGNQSRGIDILNQGSAVANIRLGDGTATNANTISGNVEEGVYVVNTASLTETQAPMSATMPLAADGPGLAAPDMILDINRNTISGNNTIVGGFVGGGLAVRVGTSGASSFFTNADASGNSQVLNGVGSNSAGLADGNGRVNARVVDNTFSGNQGDDVIFESFVSTVDPIATAGTWDAMMFNVTAYEGDPLARLNLAFRGNTGQSLDVTRAGASYNNAEPNFKSKLVTSAPGGPFLSDSRERNAQRIPTRDAEFTPPIISPDFGIFEYPGTGISTFRIESDFETTNFLTGDTFAIDGTPVPPQLNVNPNAVPLGIDVGELGFSWSTVAPGTFGFDEPFTGLFGLP